MLVSEENEAWQSVPRWMGFLIQMGYDWPGSNPGQRRIALLSMPCDSAAAGLIALGALVKDFGDPNTNNVDGHYDALLRYAHQYLESCRDCDLPECNPEVKRCGYMVKAAGRLRSLQFPRKTFTISDKTDFKKRQIAWEYPNPAGHEDNVTQFPSPTKAMSWHIEGEPPPQLTDSVGALSDEAYQQIVVGAKIIPDNLRKSYNGLCLAGRVYGETATREVCESIRFRDASREYFLPDLLTIHGWSSSNLVSRITFFNARTEKLDRRAPAPSLVVADGDTCFLKVLGIREFQQSDVIGVMHRTIKHDELEAVGNRLIALRQWYVEDSEMLGCLPRGISVLILKKRTS